MKKRKANPRQNANLLSKITFLYTRGLFRKGLKRELTEDDLYEVVPDLDSAYLGDRVEKEWSLQKRNKRALLRIFWKMFGRFYIFLGLTNVIVIFFNVIRPILIGKLVYFFHPGQTDLSKLDAYIYSILIIGLNLVVMTYRHNYLFTVEALAINVRTAICSLLYRKFLKIPASRLGVVSFGEITNLITKDINEFEKFFFNFNDAWTGFIAVLIVIYNMYQKIGLPSLIALAAFAVFIPINILAAIWMNSLKIQSSNKTDTRISKLREVMSSIRCIKMYGWEQYSQQRITDARKEEINILAKVFTSLFITVVTANLIYNIAFYLVLMTCVWVGQPLTAEILYYITGSFLCVGFSLMTMLPYGIFHTSQIMAALKRMQILFEKLEKQQMEPVRRSPSSKPQIAFCNVTAKREKIILEKVNLKLETGLTMLTGYANSGKTTLLMTILNEVPLATGTITSEGQISYASQEPWLFPSTIKDNILFGSPYNHKRYQDVLDACALRYDVNVLQNGDLTVISEQGINVSKGQKCRINLARAIYRNADIYLLDDCLSSLDSLVSQQLFTNCIMKFLKDKLVILVSENPNFAEYANNVIVINNAKVCVKKNMTPKEAIVIENTTMVPSEEKKEEEEEKEFDCTDKLLPTSEIYSEENKVGSVDFQVYKKFIQLGGGLFFFVIIFLTFALAQASLTFRDKLISGWANIEQELQSANSTNYDRLLKERNEILFYYSGSVLFLLAMTLARAYMLLVFAKAVSKNLHQKMMDSVIGASIRFFDNTCIGNIVNRFSKDIIVVDENIPFTLHHLAAILFECLGNLIMIASTNPWFLIGTLVLFVALALVRNVYLKLGRPLKRLEASTKSPVVGYLNTTLEGLPSIKAFHVEDMMRSAFEKSQDLYTSATYSSLSCIKAFVLAADILTTFLIAAVILQFVTFNKGVSPGDVGLAISQVFMMSGILYFALTQWAQIETQMTSMERALEYTTIKKEESSKLQIPEWPQEGRIKYENVYLKHSETYMLKNINLVIGAREKIGIVGRTGAGKSSMISALFRLYDIEGRILIDGVDTKRLSLSFLRSRISVIPQDSILFDGTLRENIDPGSLSKDEEIWDVLRRVKLDQLTTHLYVNVKDLDISCSQKQLICLVRVLLKDTKILVLDEMIESVDANIEELINQIIEEKFDSCTVIKIAHKLQFVINCDKVLVLNQGEIVEFENPHVLLQDKNSVFFKMVKTSSLEF